MTKCDFWVFHDFKGDAKHGYILIETIYTNIYNHAFMFSH